MGFQKGYDPKRNYEGRPKGSISPISRIRQIFNENPERFEAFLESYLTDEKNHKHIVEMLDGKPFQRTDVTSGGDKINITFDSVYNNEATRGPEDSSKG